MSRVLKIKDPDGIYFVTCTIVAWVDLFTRVEHRKFVVDSLAYCQKEKGLRIHAYVVMSNHLHMVISSSEPDKHLSGILRDFKKFTAKQILEAIHLLPESRREWMLQIFSAAGKYNSNNKNFQIWQQDNHPIELRTLKFIEQKIYYIHQNPVRAGFVHKAEEYIFSSACVYRGKPWESLLDIEMLEW
ncbi:MAG: REP-associated tyrosine transposase [Saprospiraceae bacterium]